MKRFAVVLAVICFGCKPSDPLPVGGSNPTKTPEVAKAPVDPPPDREPMETIDRFWADFKGEGADPMALLRSLPVESVTVGSMTSETNNPATVIRQYSGPGKVLNAKAWKAFVDDLVNQGYRPKQAEWVADEEQPPDGFGFRVIIMVFKDKESFQAQLKGSVQVRWSDRKDAEGYVQPKSIVATDWHYLEFVQDPKFPTNAAPVKAGG